MAWVLKSSNGKKDRPSFFNVTAEQTLVTIVTCENLHVKRLVAFMILNMGCMHSHIQAMNMNIQYSKDIFD